MSGHGAIVQWEDENGEWHDGFPPGSDYEIVTWPDGGQGWARTLDALDKLG